MRKGKYLSLLRDLSGLSWLRERVGEAVGRSRWTETLDVRTQIIKFHQKSTTIHVAFLCGGEKKKMKMNLNNSTRHITINSKDRNEILNNLRQYNVAE